MGRTGRADGWQQLSREQGPDRPTIRNRIKQPTHLRRKAEQELPSGGKRKNTGNLTVSPARDAGLSIRWPVVARIRLGSGPREQRCTTVRG